MERNLSFSFYGQSSPFKPLSVEYHSLVDLPGLGSTDLLIKISNALLQPYEEDILILGKMQKKKISLSHVVSGTIEKMGQLVMNFKVGEKVVAFIHPETNQSGCSSHCIVASSLTSKLIPGISPQETLACLKDSILVDYSLLRLPKFPAMRTVLIIYQNTTICHAIIHTLLSFKTMILCACANENEVSSINSMYSLVGVNNCSIYDLASFVIDETCGLGVDCIFDCRDPPNRLSTDLENPGVINFDVSSHDIINFLTLGGTWIRFGDTHFHLSEESLTLSKLKSITISFISVDAFIFSGGYSQCVLEFMSTTLERMAQKVIKPPVLKIVNANELENCINRQEANLSASKPFQIIVSMANGKST